MACLGTWGPYPPTPVLPWKRELEGKSLSPCPCSFPASSSPSPSRLAEPALFSSLLYLLQKYRLSCFSYAYRSRKGMLFIYLFTEGKRRRGKHQGALSDFSSPVRHFLIKLKHFKRRDGTNQQKTNVLPPNLR